MIKILDASLTQQEPKRNKQILPMPTTQRIIIGDPRIHLNNGNILPLGSPYEYKIPNAATLNELGKQLLLAAQNGNLDEIKALVSKGAPFTADWLGTSPLHLAAQGNHLEICVILLRAGISRDARTKVDRTPLHMAAYEGHIEVVELLLKYEAEIDCIDLLGMTPLHWATQNENIAVVATLLRHGASTSFVNKFGLTALDIANQVGRPELVEFISLGVHDPTVATENLAIELANDDNQSFQNATMMFDVDTNDAEDSQPSAENNIEDSHEDDIEEIEPEVQIDCHESEDESQISTDPIIINEDASHSFSESFKILQQHGITMLPNDDNNILTSVMESGHSVVLTDIGKDVLNAVKQSEVTNKTRYVGGKKFITVTPEEFLTLTNSNTVGKQQILRQVNGKLVPKTIKRIVMKKNKIIPISQAANAVKTKVTKVDMSTDMKTVMQQLIEARKTIEEYKIKLRKKEAEAERYKQQLLLFMKNST